MLDNFREIYNQELVRYEGGLERIILDSMEIRAFVYEVCKGCIASQQVDPADGSIEKFAETIRKQDPFAV